MGNEQGGKRAGEQRPRFLHCLNASEMLWRTALLNPVLPQKKELGEPENQAKELREGEQAPNSVRAVRA